MMSGFCNFFYSERIPGVNILHTFSEKSSTSKNYKKFSLKLALILRKVASKNYAFFKKSDPNGGDS